jgi:Fe-S cluster assembly iron-binding protein IscA
LSELGYTVENKGCQSIRYNATIDSTRRLSASTWGEFLSLLDRYTNPEGINVHSHWKCDKREEFDISIDVSHREIELAVNSLDPTVLEFVHRQLQESFHASNPAPEKSQILSKWSLKKTIFLAHRFDVQGKATAAAVQKFLSRCGFSVVEGEGYEARMVPAKVAERIESQDILVALMTAGDITWVSSEAAFAHGHRKYIVFLAEEGLEVKKGILGADYEHLTFPKGNVEKAFSDLLFALPS